MHPQERICLRAQAGGAYRLPVGGYLWPTQGGCTSPRTKVHYTPGLLKWTVCQLVRCRSCETCLSHRRALWINRALGEYAWSSRAWLVTLTLGAASRALSNGPSEDTFEKVAPTPYGRWLSKYFDRLRHTVPGLRYFCTEEAHKDGTPHWHAVVYETVKPITKRALREAWSHGFSHAVLAKSAKGVVYAAKYLVKSSGRIRASRGFGGGQPPTGVSPQHDLISKYSPQAVASAAAVSRWRGYVKDSLVINELKEKEGIGGPLNIHFYENKSDDDLNNWLDFLRQLDQAGFLCPAESVRANAKNE